MLVLQLIGFAEVLLTEWFEICIVMLVLVVAFAFERVCIVVRVEVLCL